MADIPFGETVLLWRLERELTQAGLAERAGLPRPNLSDIERGKREVSLKTIRALALSLEVSPGVLVDGRAPGEDLKSSQLSRETMERIALAVVKNKRLPNSEENDLASLIRVQVQSRLRALHGVGRARNFRPVGRAPERAWLRSVSRYGKNQIQSIMERVMNPAFS